MKSIQNFILESSAIDNLSNKLYDKFKQYGEFENIKDDGEFHIVIAHKSDEKDLKSRFPQELMNKARHENGLQEEFYYFKISDVLDYFKNNIEDVAFNNICQWVDFLK